MGSASLLAFITLGLFLIFLVLLLGPFKRGWIRTALVVAGALGLLYLLIFAFGLIA